MHPSPRVADSSRAVPTWTSRLAAAASRPIGGPLGEHAVVGRHWFWTPLRVILLLAVLTLMGAWFGKAGCIQQKVTDDGFQVLDWDGGRQYVGMCYSDIIPLYGAERLNRPGFVPYRDGWLELTAPDNAGVSVTLRGDGDGFRVVGAAVAQDAGEQRYTLADGDRIVVDGDTLHLADGTTVTMAPGDHIRFMEYPVLTGAFQWVNARITDGWLHAAANNFAPRAIPVAGYFNITALLLAFAWLVTVWSVARTSRSRSWDAAVVALSPLVIVHAFTNYDTLATAFAAGAILAWSRSRTGLAGLLLGLGAAAKLYPLFLLLPLFLLCLRAGRLRSWIGTAGAAAAAWLVVNLPVALAWPAGWREFYRLSTERDIDPDTLYNVVRYFGGWEGFDGPLEPGQAPVVLNTVTAALFLLCCAGIAVIALTAPIRPRLAQLCLLVVAAFLVTNKVWSPQFSLWLVPLAVLAIGHWRLLLGWMTIDALVWVPRMFYFRGVNNMGLPQDWFLGAVVLRDLAVLALCALVIYQIYRPSSDPMRQHGVDDDAGGVLNRARDIRVLALPRLRQPA